MLLAILFLIVAISLGTVVMTAAHSAAGQRVSFREEQQDYLAVRSAVRLIESELKNAKYSASSRLIETLTYYPPVMEGAPSHTQENKKNEFMGSSVTGSKILESLKDDLDIILKDLLAAPLEAHTITIKSEHGMPDVIGTFKVSEDADSRFDITVTLKSEDGSNAVTVHFSAMASSDARRDTFIDGNVTTTTTTDTVTVTWAVSTAAKGEGV